ncbi:hypothetical protein MCOR07_005081 [Pyricularia oryzae]|nr:hypothetical protein MCOR19_009984 [Pyricularia oryzae]KAI6266209.1 hypothetical protein MCOR26_010330 [Pyricularia oryzae]KAI6335286.1 hypothetical protein MCOR29_000443 [Pyricularia oryzae]KAI6343387.1 hypothetical protein MCOR30_001557 [Pyricularia oryzae]KAI6343503.1 hypothetical protein MCOR28_004840 [Pyricularia oryzae]
MFPFFDEAQAICWKISFTHPSEKGAFLRAAGARSYVDYGELKPSQQALTALFPQPSLCTHGRYRPSLPPSPLPPGTRSPLIVGGMSDRGR